MHSFLCVPGKTIFIQLTFVISVQEKWLRMTSVQPLVQTLKDYDLEVEGLPNLSSTASNQEGTQEAYADDPLVEKEWLEL